MTFREDQSRIRKRHLRENVAWLNRFAWSLLKQHPGRQSLVMKRLSSGWSDAFGSHYWINTLVCDGHAPSHPVSSSPQQVRDSRGFMFEFRNVLGDSLMGVGVKVMTLSYRPRFTV